MPFTGSHPAAILPLLHTGLPASALVIGSLAPDLPYFVPIRIGDFHPPTSWGVPTHTLWALGSLDLLIGMVAWTVWHGVLAAPLIHLAPPGLASRLLGRVDIGLRHRLASPRGLLKVALALVIGAATHVLWDEFTHVGRWGATHVPALSATWAGLAGYRWAQYASGVFGGLALAIWLVAWWRRTPPQRAEVDRSDEATPRLQLLLWSAVIGPGVVVGVGAAVAAADLRAAAFAGATAGGGAALAALMIVCLAWHGGRSRLSTRP